LAKEISLTCVEVARSADGIVVEGGNDNTIVPILLMTISQDPSVTKTIKARIQNEGSRRRSRIESEVGPSKWIRGDVGNNGLRSSTAEESVDRSPEVREGALILNAPIR